MSKSQHQIVVKGKDETAGAFASIQARAAAASLKMRQMLGKAMAAAGAYLGVRSISRAINELGNLSDLAMRAGTSVDELTRASTAFQIAGLPMSVEQLATAMQYMQKNTGQTGLGAFMETAKKISEINDGAERGKELVKNFGRAGLQLQPLVSNGKETVEQMRLLAILMPGVSDAAAKAGDEMADAQKVVSDGIHRMWLNVIGKLCRLWGEDFPGGVRAGALNAMNWVSYAMKKIFYTITKWGAQIGMAGQALFSWMTGDQSWDEVWDEYGRANEELEKEMDAQLARIEADREEFKKTLAKLDPDRLSDIINGKKGKGAVEATAIQQRVTNELVLGGSNAARRMMILGPTLQTEMKKQTQLLENIDNDIKAQTNEGLDLDLAASNL